MVITALPTSRVLSRLLENEGFARYTLEMAQGPGKYDKECTLVRESASAQVALVIVIGGDRGDGFAMQAGTDVPPSVVAQMLRNVAAQIDASIPKGN